MIPISDVIPSRKTPVVTLALIVLNVLVYVAGFPWPAFIASQFLHAGWAHLIANMLCLWIFGDNVEDRLGHVRFGLFYLVAGVSAAALQTLLDPLSSVPMVGASGAIAGVMGAYFVIYPNSRVLTFIFVNLVEVPAVFFLAIWFLWQVISGVASWAHAGGLAVGAAFGLVLRLRGTRRWESPEQLA